MNFIGAMESQQIGTHKVSIKSWYIEPFVSSTNLLPAQGESLNTFFEKIKSYPNSNLYIHNLKFAGNFIINYLLNNSYKCVLKYEDVESNSFLPLINDNGEFYNIKIYFYKKNKKVKYINIIDSSKILPYAYEELIKMFNIKIPANKNILDLKSKVYIMKQSLNILFKNNLTHSTLSSNALYDFIEGMGYIKYKHYFPNLSQIDKDLRQSYRGGFVYINPQYLNTTVKNGIVLDVNSLYSSMMYNNLLPFGYPLFFKGKYKDDYTYPLYIQLIKVKFKIKPNFIPTIQIKNLPLYFRPSEWIEDSGEDSVYLALTNIDIDIFLKHYEIETIEYINGWKFRGSNIMFKKYIDKWNNLKIISTTTHHDELRNLSKMMLNALSGKFGSHTVVRCKRPTINNNIVSYKMNKEENINGIYLPLSIFITSYARHFLLNNIQKLIDYSIKKYNVNKFIYADTDSIHTTLSPDECKNLLEIDERELGKWKIENTFKEARYLKPKCYIQRLYDNNLKIACAGLSKSEFSKITWENFNSSLCIEGKNYYRQVEGGVIIEKGKYTLNSLEWKKNLDLLFN